MRKAVAILLVALVGVGGVFLAKQRQKQASSDSKELKITTSIYPIYFLATYIGGENVEVKNLVPMGVEPHDYELTPEDIGQIENSDVLFINGVIESWSTKVKPKVMVELGKTLIQNKDPHIWLDPLIMLQMADAVSSQMEAKDPIHAKDYRQRATDLISQLNQLDTEFRNQLRGCKNKDLVTAHTAWGYLASRYGLNQIAIAGLDPEQEPSAKDLAAIVNTVRAKKVKAVYFEELTSPKLAQTIASETGAQSLALNPLEGLTNEQMQAGKNYLTEQKQNLNQLVIGLECK